MKAVRYLAILLLFLVTRALMWLLELKFTHVGVQIWYASSMMSNFRCQVEGSMIVVGRAAL